MSEIEDEHIPIITKDQKNEATNLQQKVLSFVLSTLTVFTILLYSLSITLSASSAPSAGTDSYSISVSVLIIQTCLTIILVAAAKLFFSKHCSIPIYHKHFWIVILIAVFNIMSILAVTYSGHKDRTSEHNQVVLFACQIPFTALIRWAILRQGISLPQCICITGVFIGVLVGSLPPLFSKDITESHWTDKAIIFWPFVFFVGQIMCVFCFVMTEKLHVLQNLYPISAFTWETVVSLIIALLLFWTDLIPDFGYASSASDMGGAFSRAWWCMWTPDEQCGSICIYLWLMNIAFPMYLLLGILIVDYSYGAIYLSLLTAMTLPLGTAFWTLFRAENGHMEWEPSITSESVWAFIGLAITIVFTILFEYFSTRSNRNVSSQQDIGLH